MTFLYKIKFHETIAPITKILETIGGIPIISDKKNISKTFAASKLKIKSKK